MGKGIISLKCPLLSLFAFLLNILDTKSNKKDQEFMALIPISGILLFLCNLTISCSVRKLAGVE